MPTPPKTPQDTPYPKQDGEQELDLFAGEFEIEDGATSVPNTHGLADTGVALFSEPVRQDVSRVQAQPKIEYVPKKQSRNKYKKANGVDGRSEEKEPVLQSTARANKGGTSTDGKPPKKPCKLLASLTPKQKKLALIAGGVVLVLLIGIVTTVIILSKNGGDAPDGDSSIVTESGYNKGANVLPVEELEGTILTETKDAGEAYITESLFLGDSNTVRMLQYRDDTHFSLDNSIGYVGMGIGGLNSERFVQFKGVSGTYTMAEAVGIMKPRRVFINFGTNNAGGSVDGFISSYADAIESIREEYKYCDIIITAVFPIAQKHINSSLSMTQIDEFNVALAKLAEKEDCKFLNWSEVLTDAATGYAKEGYMLTTDGVHITKVAAQALAKYVRTHAYITKDERPDRGKIPARLDTLPDIVTNDPSGTIPSGTKSQSSSSSATSSNASVDVNVSYNDNYGSVYIDGYSNGAAIPAGTTITLTATAKNGGKFVGWSGAVSATSETITFTVPSTGPVYITANFVAPSSVATTPPATTLPPATTAPPATTPPPVATAPPATTPPATTPPPVSTPPAETTPAPEEQGQDANAS